LTVIHSDRLLRSLLDVGPVGRTGSILILFSHGESCKSGFLKVLLHHLFLEKSQRPSNKIGDASNLPFLSQFVGEVG